MGGLVAWNGGKSDTPRQGVEISTAERPWFVRLPSRVINNLDRADDDDLAGLEQVSEIVVGTKRHFHLVNFDDALQRIAVRIDHRAPQFLLQQPRRVIGDPQLPLQLSRRHAIGMRGHQMRGPEPGRQRQLGSVHQSTGRSRGMPTTVSTRISV